MIHTENNRKITADILRSLLKSLSMLKMIIWYGNNTVQNNSPDTLGIKCIRYNKVVRSTLENIRIEDFITVFVTNVVFMLVYL